MTWTLEEVAEDPVVREYIRIYSSVCLKLHETPRWRVLARLRLEYEKRRIELYRAQYEFDRANEIRADMDAPDKARDDG